MSCERNYSVVEIFYGNEAYGFYILFNARLFCKNRIVTEKIIHI